MSETVTITAARFAALLEAYGADIARWPQEERLAAHAYAETAPEAAQRLAEARTVDALLAAIPEPRPSTRLEAAILAQIHAVAPLPQKNGGVAGFLESLWPRAAVWKPASVFVSALVLGAVLGGNLMEGTASTDTGAVQEDVLAYAVPALVQDLN
jgi:hypothetical protein